LSYAASLFDFILFLRKGLLILQSRLQSGLELLILESSWDYRCMLPCSAKMKYFSTEFGQLFIK
jgi:hypothetical protein